MNLIITIVYTPSPEDKENAGRVGVQFEGDLNTPVAAIMKGLSTFINEMDAKFKEAELAGQEPKTLGDLFPEG